MAGRHRKSEYKRCGLLGNENRRKRLADQKRSDRENKRNQALTHRRGLETDEDVLSEPTDRLLKLQEWKQRRDVKEVENSRIKPAFIVGKIKYNDSHLYKPPESSSFRPPKGVVPVKTPVVQRVTRSNARNKQQNGNAQSVKDAMNNFFAALKSPKRKPKPKGKSKKTTADILNRTFDSPVVKITSAGPVAPVCSAFIATTSQKNPVVKDQLEKQECISNSKKAGAVVHSPSEKMVTLQQESRKPGIPKCDVPETTNILGKSEKSVDYFRALYNDSTKKLNSLCEKWRSLKMDGPPDSVCDSIDVAVGYAQLLVSQKLRQFDDLVTQHENSNTTELKVLSTDLDGFWGIVNVQVEDIYSKFEKLEALKNNFWKEFPEKLQLPEQKRPLRSKPVKAKGNATSGLRSFLARARQHVKEDKDENIDPVIASPKPMSPAVMRVSMKAKQINSPRTQMSSTVKMRSPLVQLDKQNETLTVRTPGSVRRQEYAKIINGETPVRRSARIASSTPANQ